jgi:hypothetical protein
MTTYRRIGLAASLLLLALETTACAYLSTPFNAQTLLKSADVVCQGRVMSVEPHHIEPDASFQPPLNTKGQAARVRILNVIKGSVGESVTVVYRLSAPFVDYTELTQGQECILFLHSQGTIYRFVDDHNGTLKIPSHQPLHYQSKTPEGRMIEELIFGTAKDTRSIRLFCAEQLAAFPSEVAVGRLQELALEDDMAVQGVAYAGLIVMDHPPRAEALSEFFARTEDTKSLARFRTTAYGNCQLKARVLGELESRFNIIARDYDNAPFAAWRRAARAAGEKWKDFNLIGFLKSSSWQNRDLSCGTDNGVIAKIVAEQIDENGVPSLHSRAYRKGSKAIVSRLLGSDNPHARFAAALAIDKMINEPHKFPFPGWQAANGIGHSDRLDAYVEACRKWIASYNDWTDDTE